MKKNNNMSKFQRIFDWIIIIVQTILSIVVMYLTKKILPFKYWIVVVVVVVCLLIIMIVKIKGKKQRTKVRRLLNRIISLMISLILAFGSSVAINGLSVLDNITGGKYQTRVISMAVLKDSTYKNINDLNNMSIGVVSSIDSGNITIALEDISSKIAVDVLDQNDFDSLQSALVNQEVDAILFNEAYRGIIEEFFNNFESQTRVIYQFEIKEEVKSSNNRNVNVTKDTFNIYISGIDTYGPVSTMSRTDVNMLMTVNPKTKQILLTSIPRDYYVYLPSYGAYDKLTHSGIYGVEESILTVENLLEIDIDYYARVNFTSLVSLVDALGGITVANPEAFSTASGYYFGSGNISMDGDEALAFSRERYSLAGGDRARVVNQQRVLTGILNKLMSPAVITNYNALLNSISGLAETSLLSSDIQNLIQMQLNDMSGWAIEQISLDGAGSTSYNCYSMPGYALYVMEANEESVASAKNAINALK